MSSRGAKATITPPSAPPMTPPSPSWAPAARRKNASRTASHSPARSPSAAAATAAASSASSSFTPKSNLSRRPSFSSSPDVLESSKKRALGHGLSLGLVFGMIFMMILMQLSGIVNDAFAIAKAVYDDVDPSRKSAEDGGFWTHHQQYVRRRDDQGRLIFQTQRPFNHTHLYQTYDRRLAPLNETDALFLTRLQPTHALPAADAMAACLKFMDDNHFLVEWLAYHYHTLNLRYLVVLPDDKSKTTPVNLLRRWEGRMEIQVWNDEIVMPPPELNYDIEASKKYEDIYHHRDVQFAFDGACARHFKQRNIAWVMVTDTDEFVVYNRRIRNAKDELYRGKDAVPKLAQPGSMMNFLHQERNRDDANPCIFMQRYQFNSIETPLDKLQANVPRPFRGKDFATQRWRTVVETLPRGKNIIDLTTVELEDIPLKTSMHCIVPKYCPEPTNYGNNVSTALMANQFLGTWEQFSFRHDPRARRKRNHQYYGHYNDMPGEQDASLVPWLYGFAHDVGMEDAIRLLRDVGSVYAQ